VTNIYKLLIISQHHNIRNTLFLCNQKSWLVTMAVNNNDQ